MIASGKDSSAARATYGAAAAVRGNEKVTPLLREAGERPLPLRDVTGRVSSPQGPTLPVMATAGDVRELVRLLKKRPNGVTLVAAMNSEQKRIFDPRKIAAYEFWGIASRDGERLRLTPLGMEVARQLEPEARIYRRVLDHIVSYRAVLEWVARQGLDLVTHLDVAAYWQEHYPDSLDDHDEKTIEGSVVCFFHLCQAAELGTMTIGKRGQPARLHVERRELFDYLKAEDRPTHPVEGFEGDDKGGRDDSLTGRTGSTLFAGHEAKQSSSPQALRLLISHAGQMKIVDQIRVTLELAGIESAVVERNSDGAGPVAEHIIRAMRQCEAAVILVSAEDCSRDETGVASVNEDVLIEIGAAFVCYDRRVVLLWDEGVPVPSNLRTLSRCQFSGGTLTWDAGVRLMKAITELRD